MEKTRNPFRRTKYACYSTYLATAPVFALPPLLFVTFREMYDISYTLLGTLVLVNFITQLSVDLLFSFFSKHFNIRKVTRCMPLLTCAGLLTYALVPTLFPQHAYVGLVIGTVIFSAAAGLGEVFLSPTVAALPSDRTERDLSILHSLYGYGVVSVVLVTTVFFQLFGTHNWAVLTCILAALPLVPFVLFCTSPMPEINLTHETTSHSAEKRKRFIIGLCLACIFLGSAAENAMTNWISGFIESALQIPKATGDILGLALFATLLALTRTVYAKYGKNIVSILFWGMVGATVCYVVAGLSTNSIVSLIACTVTGICTSMLWPGTLIMMEEKLPHAGVVAYALMAAGGDFGASVAPQLLGGVVDMVSASNWATELSGVLAISTEQIGMKTGMLISAIFPALGIFLLLYIRRYFAKIRGEKPQA